MTGGARNADRFGPGLATEWLPAGPETMVDTASKAIGTEALFGDRREILIQHGETIYRLRITSKDKLILTK